MARLFNRFFDCSIFSIKKGKNIQRDIDADDEVHLSANYNFSNASATENIKLMSPFTIRSREEFARKTKSLVLYLPDEVGEIRRFEETAALRAMPIGYSIQKLNGLNIGCGDRRISEHLIPVDIMRQGEMGHESGEHHAFLPDAWLANPEDLPFKISSVDFIIALHMLEHVSNPVEILLYWGSLLKPGGGIGLILPNFRYTWDASGDTSKFGHKWNTSPDIFLSMYERYLKDVFHLEHLDTLERKISFDVVLRKPGEFRQFSISNITSLKSGAQLFAEGVMPGQEDDSLA